MGNKVFKVPIELHDGTVLPDDLGSGGASVHVGDDPPAGTPNDGALWIDTDEVTGDLMGYPVESGYTSLSPGIATVKNTWEQLGTETIVFPGPFTSAVDVRAELGGALYQNSTGTQGRSGVGTRIQISLDGGATWEKGNEPLSEINRLDTGLINVALSPTISRRYGVPTGDVIIKAEFYQINTPPEAGSVEIRQAAIKAELSHAEPVVLDNRYVKQTPGFVDASAVITTYYNGYTDWGGTAHGVRFWKQGRTAFARGLISAPSSPAVPSGTHLIGDMAPNWHPAEGFESIFMQTMNNHNPRELRIKGTGSIELTGGHGLTSGFWISLAGMTWLTGTEAY